jgi:acyl dehydratase
MPIDRASLLDLTVEDEPCSYSERGCILYALGVGFGADPGDRAELAYVYEGGPMRTVPTMANRFLASSFLDGCGLNQKRLVHVGESLELYRPLPPAAKLLRNLRVSAVDDLGKAHGARIVIEAELRLAADDTVLCTCSRTLLARADGGFGRRRTAVAPPHRLPGREPDLSCEFRTRSDLALIFRLVDTMNPIHVDRGAARVAGFRRPILQGRCTFGIACRAVLRTICDYDFTLIRGFEARLTAPVYPGDSVLTEMWQDRNVVSFRCRVPARDATVLDNGKCTLAA